MSDVKFTILKVYKHAEAKTEHMAVLRSLCPGLDASTPEHIIERTRDVLEVWRRRCNELRGVEWGPATTVKFQYMRNCPPAGLSVRVEGRGCVRPCTCATICPWCWAREVVRRTWDVLQAACVKAGFVYSKDTAAYPCKLVVRTGRRKLPGRYGQLPTIMSGLATELTRARRQWQGKALGAALLMTVEPAGKSENAKTKDEGWVVHERFMALVPADVPVTDPRVRVVDVPTMKALAVAVAKFARYPAGLLYGDVKSVRGVLEARYGHRLLRFIGGFSKLKSLPGDLDAR